MPQPANPKIYHIVHVDRLASIVADGHLWCDAEVNRRAPQGTLIGLNTIKDRRLNQLALRSHPDLFVGQCVPFYFCPRSIMLYLIYRANLDELLYRGGQGPIIHLESDLQKAVAWADRAGYRWAFTGSNAGARYFEDWCELEHLCRLNWEAIQSNRWAGSGVSASLKEGKQAEFLVEFQFPWGLVDRIGVHSKGVFRTVKASLINAVHKPDVELRLDWYYP